MTTKTNAEMLKSFIQMNKVAREKKAVKLGYKNAQEYIDFLKGLPTQPIKKTSKIKEIVGKMANKLGKSNPSSDSTPTIHIVDVLDVSGSMQGRKLDAAVEGINHGINELKKEKDVNYLYTYCEFSSATDVRLNHVAVKVQNVNTLRTSARGMTALNDAIGMTLTKLVNIASPSDKVLVNIYTDGGENDSRKYSKETISNLIEEVSGRGFTVTFIGTATDVKNVQRDLKIDDSNTLVHDNTGESIAASFNVNSASRSLYAEKVKKGEDVSKGFYKNIK